MPLRRASPRRRLVKFCTKRFRGNVVGSVEPHTFGSVPCSRQLRLFPKRGDE
jgi:hypothetical protein